MNVKEAVAFSKQYLLDLFADENPSNVGLEEIEFDEIHRIWSITIGFSRPWDASLRGVSALVASNMPARSYKIVRISDSSGQVISVKNREIQEAA